MRKSGILLPISSLPSNYGIGALGDGAYSFIDFLKKSGQYYWQILPINPTSFGNSPYQSFSAFAFNPYFIDLDLLVNSGLLKKDECECVNSGNDPRRVDYSLIYKERPSVLKKAVERFDTSSDRDYEAFCKENEFWLDDYALFMALKERFGMRPLKEFPLAVRIRDEEVLEKMKTEYQRQTTFYKVTQYLFYLQWIKLKKYANHNGVHIIGDLPIYVSEDSADVWAHPELFSVADDRSPLWVAGCPPDSFSPDGQLWGNPVYMWSEHEKDGYSWWLRRLKQANELFDAVRIDHFRGFYCFYRVQAGATTAKNGEWVDANGEELMKRVKSTFPKMKIIAEDLGLISDEVKKRMASSGFPGMKILQFAFSGDDNENLPHNFSKNSVVYTGTHDNNTLLGWIASAKKAETHFAADYLGLSRTAGLCEGMIRCAMASVCDTAIIPMHDYLRQGSDSRINTPSTLSDNWIYRIQADDLDDNLTDKIYRLTKLYFRL